ncbi:MAG: AbrB/MazE/SpoVT family DNA-binding domain-containing protein [Chloroflexi bacterium]|nr:AbrB/MazE/SpoVT family DNA-binding domain-containing protein [Chloroflexota bacterium]
MLYGVKCNHDRNDRGGNMESLKTKVGEGGRVVIPAEYRKKLGIRPGDDVVVVLEGDELRLFTIQQAVRRIQELVRQYVPEGVSLTDELLEDRRKEAF